MCVYPFSHEGGKGGNYLNAIKTLSKCSITSRDVMIKEHNLMDSFCLKLHALASQTLLLLLKNSLPPASTCCDFLSTITYMYKYNIFLMDMSIYPTFDIRFSFHMGGFTRGGKVFLFCGEVSKLVNSISNLL